MENLKEKLLDTGCFEDNEWLDKYVELVQNSSGKPAVKGLTERHHILPRKYFSYFGLPRDDSKDNIVNLEYGYHVLAHFYLFKCAAVYWLRDANLRAFLRMFGGSNKDKIGEQDILDNLNNLNEISSMKFSDEYCQYMSDIAKSEDGPIKKWRREHPDEFSKVQSEIAKRQLGTHQTEERKKHESLGRLKYFDTHEHHIVSDETKNKLSNSLMGHEVPQEERDKISKSVAGFISITNGKTNIHAKQNELEIIFSMNLGYRYGTTKGLKCKNNKQFYTQVIDKNDNYHWVHNDELNIWLQNGWFLTWREAKRSN